jgi:hypothetical protein
VPRVELQHVVREEPSKITTGILGTRQAPQLSTAPQPQLHISTSPPDPRISITTTMSDYAHLLPTTYKATIASWLTEDTPSFDYGGYVVGEAPKTATLYCKSPVGAHPRTRPVQYS